MFKCLFYLSTIYSIYLGAQWIKRLLIKRGDWIPTPAGDDTAFLIEHSLSLSPSHRPETLLKKNVKSQVINAAYEPD